MRGSADLTSNPTRHFDTSQPFILHLFPFVTLTAGPSICSNLILKNYCFASSPYEYIPTILHLEISQSEILTWPSCLETENIAPERKF